MGPQGWDNVVGMVSGKRLVAEMAQRREEEKKRFAKLEVSHVAGRFPLMASATPHHQLADTMSYKPGMNKLFAVGCMLSAYFK